MNETNGDAELLNLCDRWCNEQLSAEQSVRLQDLLRNDPAAQRTYLNYLDLHLGLKHLVAVESDDKTLADEPEGEAPEIPAGKRTRFAFGPARAAGLVVAASVLFIVLFFARKESLPLQIAAKVVQALGRVQVYGPDGQARALTVDMRVAMGERVETLGPGALAVIAFDDGTQLALVNDASATCVAGDPKRVELHNGVVSAQVAPQPPGRPMLLSTPSAKIEVLGTRFAIAAAGDRTELNVAEGRVRLTRVSDGRSVEVAQGQEVVAGGEPNLTVREADGPSDAWGVDFEHGVPEGWTGALATADLPDGSAGAIRTVGNEADKPVVYVIESREQWVEGLFAIHDDSHLHITMKMQRPDWLNVFMSTRGSDATTPTWALHNFNEVPFWPPKPGQWRTITIPLAKFRRKRDGVFRRESPAVGDVAYWLSISATEPDRGLVVDRIWVTRGGPGEVEAKPLP